MKPRHPIHPGEMLLGEFLRPAGERVQPIAGRHP
jgi:plasmid maintenance system antidote protein VapI